MKKWEGIYKEAICKVRGSMERVARSVFFPSHNANLFSLMGGNVQWEEIVSVCCVPNFYRLSSWVVTELFLFIAKYVLERSVKIIL